MHTKNITIPFCRSAAEGTEASVSIQTLSKRGTNIHLQHIEAARISVNSAIPNEARACEGVACGIGVIVGQDCIEVVCPAGQYACALNAARHVVGQIESAPLLISA